jgi:hypothetical protein
MGKVDLIRLSGAKNLQNASGGNYKLRITDQYSNLVRILHKLPQRERAAPDGDAVAKDVEGEAGWYETMKQIFNGCRYIQKSD